MQFKAKIQIINGNPYVAPPPKVLDSIFKQAKKKTSPIPIKGTINNGDYAQSLMRYMGGWRLYINGIMAKAAGIKYKGSITAIVGQEVTIKVVNNPKPIVYPMVAEFKKQLDGDPVANKAYEALTPGRKKEILRYFSFMKTKESLMKNIDRVMKHLKGEKTDALHPLMHKTRGGK